MEKIYDLWINNILGLGYKTRIFLIDNVMRH